MKDTFFVLKFRIWQKVSREMIRPEGSSNEKAEKTISSSWFWLRVMSCVMGK